MWRRRRRRTSCPWPVHEWQRACPWVPQALYAVLTLWPPTHRMAGAAQPQVHGDTVMASDAEQVTPMEAFMTPPPGSVVASRVAPAVVKPLGTVGASTAPGSGFTTAPRGATFEKLPRCQMLTPHACRQAGVVASRRKPPQAGGRGQAAQGASMLCIHVARRLVTLTHLSRCLAACFRTCRPTLCDAVPGYPACRRRYTRCVVSAACGVASCFPTSLFTGDAQRVRGQRHAANHPGSRQYHGGGGSLRAVAVVVRSSRWLYVRCCCSLTPRSPAHAGPPTALARRPRVRRRRCSCSVSWARASAC